MTYVVKNRKAEKQVFQMNTVLCLQIGAYSAQ